MRRIQRQRTRQIAQIVSGACGLVHALEGVRAVHIVARGRPTFEQMRRYRHAARNGHAGLTVSGEGVISIRPEAR